MSERNIIPNRKREKQTRYLSQAIQLEEAVNPHIIRATMTMVSFAIIVFLVWAGFTNINEVARTSGEVVPQGYQQSVQHLEGGLVKTISVKDGDFVSRGDIMIELDDVSIGEDLARAKSKQLSLELKGERLRAFVAGREPDFEKFEAATEKVLVDQKSFFEGMRNARQKEEEIIRDQIKQKDHSISALQGDLVTAKENHRITNNVYIKRKMLNEKGYASDMQLLEDQRRVNEIGGEIKRLESQIESAREEINEYEDRLISLSARHHDEAYEILSGLSAEKAQNIKIIEKLEERIARMSVRAPSDGLVKGLSVNTIGAVVQPGQVIAEIIPMDRHMEVQVKILPQHIGHLKKGQAVQVKFSTFDFSRYGSVTGTLDHISATTFSGDQGERYYQGRISLDKNHVGANTDNVVLPGMTVMADVITGEKTILQYMLKPIHVSLRTAFSER